MFDPPDAPDGRPPTSGVALGLLAVATALLVGILAYSHSLARRPDPAPIDHSRADRAFALGLASLGLIGTAAGLLVVRLRRTAARLEQQEAEFRTFLDNSPVIAYVKDADGRYRYVSRAGRERFGLAAGGSARDVLSPEAAAAVEASDKQAVASGRPVTVEVSGPGPDGAPAFWLATKFPLPGRAGLLGGMSVDVTDRRRVETALAASEERLRLVVSRLPAIVCVADPDGTVALMEGQGLDLLGRPPGDGVGRPFGEALRGGPIHPLPLALALAGQEQLLAATAAGRAFDVHYLPKRDATGQVVRVVAVALDVTDREAKAQRLELARTELEGLARRDALTGLPNRRALDERLAEECRRADRQGQPLAVVLGDVDHFKRLNDALGHPAGDRALAAVAAALRAAARATDVVARYGGEEFCVLLPGADVAAAVTAAERLRAAVAAAEFPDRPVTASFGVAGWRPGDPHPPSPAALLAAADRAMYRAKANGRDRVEADAQTVAVTG